MLETLDVTIEVAKIKEYYTESVHYEWKRLVQDAYHR
jgi:hypothetical protein